MAEDSRLNGNHPVYGILNSADIQTSVQVLWFCYAATHVSCVWSVVSYAGSRVAVQVLRWVVWAHQGSQLVSKVQDRQRDLLLVLKTGALIHRKAAGTYGAHPFLPRRNRSISFSTLLWTRKYLTIPFLYESPGTDGHIHFKAVACS